jgi:hypothetical protein
MNFIEDLEKKLDNKREYGFEETISPSNGEISASQNILSFWNLFISELIKNNTRNKDQLLLLTNMKKYPNNSNLENYMLLNDILVNRDIDEIFNEILEQPEFKTNQKNTADILNIIGPIGSFYKRKRRVLSLMLLKSRNTKTSFFSKNYGNILYKNIINYFFNIHTFLIDSNPNNDPEIFKIIGIDQSKVNDNNTTSYYIKTIFINFIKTRKMVTIDYIKNLVYGNDMYNIYKNSYQNSDNIEIIRNNFDPVTNTEIKDIFSIKDYKTIIKKVLTKDDIVKKTFDWLNVNDTNELDRSLNKFAVSYIFSIYSPGDINTITDINKICREISELKDELNEDLLIQNSQNFKSIFSDMNQDTFQENLGNKLNKLIKSGGMNVTKKNTSFR